MMEDGNGEADALVADLALDAETPSPVTVKEDHYTVKCSLGRLGCHPALCEKIESVARRVHLLALRGTHLATELLYRAARSGGALPDVDSHTWWYRVLVASGTSNQRGIPTEMKEAAGALFRNQTIVDTKFLWPFVASLAKDLRQDTSTMLRQNIHREISKAIQRLIVLWEVRTSLSLHQEGEEAKKLLYSIIRYAERRGTGHRDATTYPETAPMDLKQLLDVEIDEWIRLFPELFPCPTPKFLANYAKTKPLLAWSMRLQRQRRSCLDELSARLGSEELALQRLGSKGRAVRLLPLCSFHVQPICVYPTSLQAMLSAIRSDAPRKRKRGEEEDAPPVSDFWSQFPGARRLTRPNGDHLRKLHPFIRTDGVSASVTFLRPSAETTGNDPSNPFPKIVVDRMPGGGQPPLPTSEDNLVAIDPGRRDMITAVFSDPVKQPYVVSTKGFHRRACTSAAANVTRWSLNVAAADLRSKLEKLPSSRSFETWPLYLAAILPLMKLRVEAHQRKCVRRTRFRNYMKRDREIDRVCQDLCGGQAFVPSGLRPLGARGPAPEGLRPGRGPKAQPTIVAFGAANACSTGFGYAPAPQSRLRHRLRHVHGARVCLVDEYLTSQRCCGCGGKLDSVKEPGRRDPVWHVKRCSSCRNGRGAPLTRHRDINAATNILEIYMNLAKFGKRPLVFTRQRAEKKRSALTPSGSAHLPWESDETSASPPSDNP